MKLFNKIKTFFRGTPESFLEVGGVYIRRDGKVSGIIGQSQNPDYPFTDTTTGALYDANGHWATGHETASDLVSRV